MDPAPSGCAGKAPSPSGSCTPKSCGAAPEGQRVNPGGRGAVRGPGPCAGGAAPGGSSAPGMRGRAGDAGPPAEEAENRVRAPGGKFDLGWKASPRRDAVSVRGGWSGLGRVGSGAGREGQVICWCLDLEMPELIAL